MVDEAKPPRPLVSSHSRRRAKSRLPQVSWLKRIMATPVSNVACTNPHRPGHPRVGGRAIARKNSRSLAPPGSRDTCPYVAGGSATWQNTLIAPVGDVNILKTG